MMKLISLRRRTQTPASDMPDGDKVLLLAAVAERRRFRCCFCCHVRTGALCIGIYYLAILVAGLGVSLVGMHHPDQWRGFTNEVCGQGVLIMGPQEPQVTSEAPRLTSDASAPTTTNPLPSAPTTTKNDEKKNWAQKVYAFLHESTDESPYAAATVLALMIALTLPMLVGCYWGRPGYLLPFLCLQLLDLTLAVAILVRGLTNPGGITTFARRQLASCIGVGGGAGPSHLDSMSNECLLTFCLLLVTLYIIIKVYMMYVVWSCYKYLTYRAKRRRLRRHSQRRMTQAAKLPSKHDSASSTTEMLLPPDYEQAPIMILSPPAYVDITETTGTK